MSSHLCPECGHVLPNALVAAVDRAPQRCPHCNAALTPDRLADGHQHSSDLPSNADVAGAHTSEPAEVTATPEAQMPDASGTDAEEIDAEVIDAGLDVLDGWDVGADASEIAAWRRDERPFPTDTVVVLAAGAVGCVVGGAAWTRHRIAGAALGALAGLLTGAISRRIWRLED